MKWYFAVLKNYVGFSGRASRREFWMFMLFHFIVAFVLGFISGFFNAASGAANPSDSAISFGIDDLYLLATFLPGLAVQIRRLHDTNRTGWYSLIGIIPVIGVIIILILCAQEGTQGDNKYGEEPNSEI